MYVYKDFKEFVESFEGSKQSNKAMVLMYQFQEIKSELEEMKKQLEDANKQIEILTKPSIENIDSQEGETKDESLEETINFDEITIVTPISKVENATTAIMKFNENEPRKEYKVAISTRALSVIGETSLTTSTKYCSDNQETIDEYNKKNDFNKNQNRGKDKIYEFIKQNYL